MGDDDLARLKPHGDLGPKTAAPPNLDQSQARPTLVGNEDPPVVPVPKERTGRDLDHVLALPEDEAPGGVDDDDAACDNPGQTKHMHSTRYNTTRHDGRAALPLHPSGLC